MKALVAMGRLALLFMFGMVVIAFLLSGGDFDTKTKIEGVTFGHVLIGSVAFFALGNLGLSMFAAGVK